jgi:PAS domain S-box-containing protein
VCAESPLQFSCPAPVESEGQLEKDAEHMMIGESEPSVFRVAIEMSPVPIVLADPNRHDYPIIFANAAFCEMTGYDASEIVGRNCRFLQGPDTDKEAVARIRAAVAARWNVSEELVNYRKDGSAFWNALFVNPVFNRGGGWSTCLELSLILRAAARWRASCKLRTSYCRVLSRMSPER